MDEKDLQIFNLSMQIWQLKNSYDYNNIVQEIKERQNLMACDNYHTKKLRDVIIDFGYVAVENYFIEKANEEKEAQENE